MKYIKKKFRTQIKHIEPEYGQCKVLYIDKYNTLLHKTLYVKVKCKNCGNIVSKSVKRMKDAVKKGMPNTCGCAKIKRSVVCGRLDDGWDIMKALTTPKKEIKKYNLDGQEKTLKEWCKIYNMQYYTVLCRVRANWDLKRALTQPSQRKNHYSQFTYELKDVTPILLKNLKGIDAVYIFNVLKYVWRYPFKNGSTDLRKAKEYIQFLQDVMED